MGKYYNLSPEAVENMRTHGMPRKYLDVRPQCLCCKTQLRKDNKILVCRKHRIKSPIVQKKHAQYRVENREIIRKQINAYAKLHREEKREYDKKYSRLNRIKKRPYYAKYQRNRRRSDILYKLKDRLRERIWSAFKGRVKSKRTEELLGASIGVVKMHLEKQFKEGMTWNNHGKWHIDHIVPLALGKTKEEMEKLCHYKNLQPLWAMDNLKKGAKLSTSGFALTDDL